MAQIEIKQIKGAVAARDAVVDLLAELEQEARKPWWKRLLGHTSPKLFDAFRRAQGALKNSEDFNAERH